MPRDPQHSTKALRKILTDELYFQYLGEWDSTRARVIHEAADSIQKLIDKTKEQLLEAIRGTVLTEDILSKDSSSVLIKAHCSLSNELLEGIPWRQWQLLPLEPSVKEAVRAIYHELELKTKVIRRHVLKVERDYILMALGEKPKRKRNLP